MRHTLQREIRKSYWAYMEDTIDYTAATNNDRQTKQTKFWSYIKHLRKYSTGVSPLRSQGETFSDAPRKAKILNDQFSSVFTKETPGPLPGKGPSPHPSMPNITISTPGIQKLLANLNPHKATGPDLIPPTVLKELSHEIPPFSKLYLTCHFKLARFRMTGRKLTSPQFSKRETNTVPATTVPFH